MFNIFQFGISDWTRKSREDSLYSQLLDLPHSAFLIKFSTVVGVPTLVREYSECYQNSQAFEVTGISSTYYGRIQNFRLRTLGVPVSNSDSREALQNSLTKFELGYFFSLSFSLVVTFTYRNYNTYIGSSNAISRILRTFSKFP